MNKPEWWPENPYPEAVFTMTLERYVEAIPDPEKRTAISGCLGRHFWELASEAIWEVFKEQGILAWINRYRET